MRSCRGSGSPRRGGSCSGVSRVPVRGCGPAHGGMCGHTVSHERMRCRGPRCRVTGPCVRCCCSRRSGMRSRTMRAANVRRHVRLWPGLGVMQGLRSIQRRRANGADAKNQKSQLYGPNAVKLHPVNILPTFGSRAARSPSGVALRALNACHARLFRLGPASSSLPPHYCAASQLRDHKIYRRPAYPCSQIQPRRQ